MSPWGVATAASVEPARDPRPRCCGAPCSASSASCWPSGCRRRRPRDQIDSFTINYDVQPSGVVKVRETIVYRFGHESGRHGIERYFVTREPYDETEDAVYEIDNISVTSPDGVADPVQHAHRRGQGRP